MVARFCAFCSRVTFLHILVCAFINTFYLLDVNPDQNMFMHIFFQHSDLKNTVCTWFCAHFISLKCPRCLTTVLISEVCFFLQQALRRYGKGPLVKAVKSSKILSQAKPRGLSRLGIWTPHWPAMSSVGTLRHWWSCTMYNVHGCRRVRLFSHNCF